MGLLNKPDADRTLDRFEQWWLCENDTPLVDLAIYGQAPPDNRTYASERERWLDFEHRIERTELGILATRYLADSLPTFEPNLGPDMLATLFGSWLEFAPDTSWAHRKYGSCAELLNVEADFAGETWRQVLRFTEMGLEAGQGKWLTKFHDLHPNADIPSALIGPEELCVECADDLDLVRRTIEHVTGPCVKAYEILQAQIASTGQPSLTWMAAPHQGRMYVPQCDFSAMISTPMFEEAVVPSLRQELAATDRAIYHLDGPDALKHLDTVLAMPEVHGVQWVYGAGHGPARNWIPVYERIREAGKCMQVVCEGWEDAYAIHLRLGGRGVWYLLGGVESESDAIARLAPLGTPV